MSGHLCLTQFACNVHETAYCLIMLTATLMQTGCNYCACRMIIIVGKSNYMKYRCLHVEYLNMFIYVVRKYTEASWWPNSFKYSLQCEMQLTTWTDVWILSSWPTFDP